MLHHYYGAAVLLLRKRHAFGLQKNVLLACGVMSFVYKNTDFTTVLKSACYMLSVYGGGTRLDFNSVEQADICAYGIFYLSDAYVFVG